MPRCALTIDVNVPNSSDDNGFDALFEQILWNIQRTILFLDQTGIKATFFVQGLVAEKYPQVIEQLALEGHEVQAQSYNARPLFHCNRQCLQLEVIRTKKLIEEASGTLVNVFRAPHFSIVRGNLWALEVLADMGFQLDSSIYPIRRKTYGIENWERGPHFVKFSNGTKILEVPVSTWKIGKRCFPLSGGFWFNWMPRAVLKVGFRSLLLEPMPVILHAHVNDFSLKRESEKQGLRVRDSRSSPQPPRNTSAFHSQLCCLFQDFSFGPMREVLESWMPGKPANPMD